MWPKLLEAKISHSEKRTSPDLAQSGYVLVADYREVATDAHKY